MIETTKKKLARLARIDDWLHGESLCPCCQEVETCTPDCTFAEDAPADFEHMQFMRGMRVITNDAGNASG